MKEAPPIPARNVRGKKTRNPGYEPGNHWVICDICGCAIRAKDARFRWDNAVVCPDDWEPRHLQDFVYAKADKIVPDEPIRPEVDSVGEVIYSSSDIPKEIINTVDSLMITENTSSVSAAEASYENFYLYYTKINERLFTVDISDPASPSTDELAMTLFGNNRLGAVAIDRDRGWGYIHNGAGCTLVVVDLSDPTTPVFNNEFDIAGIGPVIGSGGYTGAGAVVLDSDNLTLYISDNWGDKVTSIDVTDPTSPSVIGTHTGSPSDITRMESIVLDPVNRLLFTKDSTLNDIHMIDMDTLAIVATATGTGAIDSAKLGIDTSKQLIFSMSLNGNSLSMFSYTTSTLTLANTVNPGIFVSTQNGFIVDEANEILYMTGSQAEIRSYDISSAPSSITALDTLTVNDGDEVNSSVVINHSTYNGGSDLIAVVDHSDRGLSIIDVTDPSNMSLVISFVGDVYTSIDPVSVAASSSV